MTDDDLPFLAALYASTRAEEVAATGWPIHEQREFLAMQHEAQHRHYQSHYGGAEWMVVERNAEPIGDSIYTRRRRDSHRRHFIDARASRFGSGRRNPLGFDR